MKFKFILQLFVIVCITTLVRSHDNLHAVNGVDPKIHYVNHMMGFKGNDSYGAHEYELLHNLMSTNTNVEFDVSTNSGQEKDLFVWHKTTNKDRLGEDFENTPTKKLLSQKVVLFKDFIAKYGKNFKSMTIETKNLYGNHKLLNKFLKIIEPYKDKVEIESMHTEDLQYIRDKGFYNTSLILLDVDAIFDDSNLFRVQVWQNVARTLLISPTAVRTSQQRKDLKNIWGGRRLGFWTLNPYYKKGKIINMFNDFYKSERKNYSDIYYMSDYNDDNETRNNLEYFNRVKQLKNVNCHDYMIKLLSYKNGAILTGKTPWEVEVLKHEFKNIDYLEDFNNLLNKFKLPKSVKEQIMRNSKYKFKTFFDFEEDKKMLSVQLSYMLNNYYHNLMKVIPINIFDSSKYFQSIIVKKISEFQYIRDFCKLEQSINMFICNFIKQSINSSLNIFQNIFK